MANVGIHVDRNASPSIHRAAGSVASCQSENLFVVARLPVRVYWGAVSIVDA